MQPRRIGRSALAVSLLALAIPAASALFFSDVLGEYQLLMWLLALIPAFLFAYERGWRGAALALALGMVVLIGTHLVLTWTGGVAPRPPIMLTILTAYVVTALGAGWLSERLWRDQALTERMALTDALTGLPNRRHALLTLEREFAAAQRDRRLAVVIFDIDRFKEYNDRNGHVAGDRALRVVASTILAHTRRMNLSARIGGDEFLSVLSDTDESGAVSFANRVRAALRAAGPEAGGLTLSCGVAAHSPEMPDVDALLAAADRALYEAKNDGRDCVRVALRPARAAPAASSPHGSSPDEPS